MSSLTKKNNTKNKNENTNENVPQFKRQFSGVTSKGENNHLPSKTVPDQHLSIAQLLINHSRGLGSDVKSYQGEYFEEETIPIINDLTDLAERRKSLRNRQVDIEEQIAQMEKEGEISPVASQPQTPPTLPVPPTEEPKSS